MTLASRSAAAKSPVAAPASSAEAVAGVALLAALCEPRGDGEPLDGALKPWLEHAFAPLSNEQRARVRRRVAHGTATLATEVAALADRDACEHAYGLALAVCEADGPLGADEMRFLERLRRFAGLPQRRAAKVRRSQRRMGAIPSVSAAPEGAS